MALFYRSGNLTFLCIFRCTMGVGVQKAGAPAGPSNLKSKNVDPARLQELQPAFKLEKSRSCETPRPSVSCQDAWCMARSRWRTNGTFLRPTARLTAVCPYSISAAFTTSFFPIEPTFFSLQESTIDKEIRLQFFPDRKKPRFRISMQGVLFS